MALFLAEAFAVVAGCLAYRNIAWAVAWSPVYLLAVVVYSGVARPPGDAFWSDVQLGTAVTLVALVSAAIGRRLRPRS